MTDHHSELDAQRAAMEHSSHCVHAADEHHRVDRLIDLLALSNARLFDLANAIVERMPERRNLS